MKTNTWIDKLLIAPALLISLFVVLIPGILTVVVSLTDWNGIKPELNFIGFRNFQELFVVTTFMISIYSNFLIGYLYNVLSKRLNNIKIEFNDKNEISKISTTSTATIIAIISTASR